MKYSKKQIQEAINFWKKLLKKSTDKNQFDEDKLIRAIQWKLHYIDDYRIKAFKTYKDSKSNNLNEIGKELWEITEKRIKRIKEWMTKIQGHDNIKDSERIEVYLYSCNECVEIIDCLCAILDKLFIRHILDGNYDKKKK